MPHPTLQALWLRPPGNVSDEEYAKFYKALSKVGLPVVRTE